MQGPLQCGATFADGEPYIILNDRILSEKPTIAAAAVALTPAGSPRVSELTFAASGTVDRACHFSNKGAAYLLQGSFHKRIRIFGCKIGRCNCRNQQVVESPELYSAQWRNEHSLMMSGLVFDDGVLYFTTHGGIDDGGKLFGLYTSDATTSALDQFFRDTDALGKTVVKMTAEQGRFDVFAGRWFPATHYGITAAFVRKYFIFGPNTFVYINGCGTLANNPLARDFKQAFFDAGASVYAGWTATADETKSAGTAKLIFDRLLGANQFALETGFKQRPFDWNSAAFDAGLHDDCPGMFPASGTKCGFDASTNAFLIITPNPKSESSSACSHRALDT